MTRAAKRKPVKPTGRSPKPTTHFLSFDGVAAKKAYAVYVTVAKHNKCGGFIAYAGKVGDNRSGCNPVISRIGNHLSHNAIHSQMRNKLKHDPEECSFTVFFTHFVAHPVLKLAGDGVAHINEMERVLKRKLKREIPDLLVDPFKDSALGKLKAERKKLIMKGDESRLEDLVLTVCRHADKDMPCRC